MAARIALAMSLALVAASAIAADGWALSSADSATRRVTVVLTKNAQAIATWILPVAKNAPEIKEHVQTRWFDLRHGERPVRILSDTWLGSVDAESAWVRIQWWSDNKRDARTRLLNELIVIPYGASERRELQDGLKIEAKYDGAG